MSKSLFEEAIADAKQLREAAEANAKNAIIEAVTPRIREFIEAQLVGGKVVNESNFLADALLSEENEGIEDETDENVELDETALRSLANLVNGTRTNESDALREAFETLTEEEQEKLFSMLREEESNKVPATAKKTASGGLDNEGEASENLYEVDLEDLKETLMKEFKNKKTSGASKMSRKTLRESYHMDEDLYELDEMMDDADLEEAILKIVGNSEERDSFDKLGLSGIEFEEEAGEDEEEEVAMGDEEGEGEEAGEAPPEGEGAPEAPLAEMGVYEIDENMLRRELSRLREARKRGRGRKAKNSSHKAAAAAFGGGMLEGDPLDVKTLQGVNQLKKKALKEAHENRALKTQLNEYRSAVQTLREQLSDLNLFNAKLLYVNKILQNKDVSPAQRRSAIEALDGASNLREAKLLYQGLTASIQSNNASINESVRHTAGMASRPVASASARIGAAGEVDRWAILAGIK
jgi:hypothetical protein